MKIALIGYGKMGREIEKVALQRGHEIVSIIDIDEEEKFLSPEFKSADVAIEFSSPKSAFNNYKRAFEANIPVVSGTTGWLEHLDEVKELCLNDGKTLFYASNFSLGVNIFFALNNWLSKLMNSFDEYDVRLEETHHIHKLDAPSGTAITLAETILSNLDRKERWILESETDNSNEQKPVSQSNSNLTEQERESITIKAFREGEVPGIHSVIYQSDIESIEITHNAKSRKGFALGAVLAAEFTTERSGFLGMRDLLGNLDLA